MYFKTAGILALALALAIIPGTAVATDGYFAHGYGTHYAGMAGAGSALSLNTLGAANNPATMVFLGKRFDLGVALFNPNRQYSVAGAPSGFPGTFGLAPGTFESGSAVFAIPSLGANWMVGEDNAVGVIIYGNGGMNTNYDTPTFGVAPTGVDLAQIFVAPTYARRLGSNHSLGVSAIFAYQRFRAEGVMSFAPFSSDPAALSDNGYANSLGYGARLGYVGELHDMLTLSASYQTRIRMGEFEEYSGLFAEAGGFDVPSNFVVGVAVRPNDALSIVFDVQHIKYSDVRSINNVLLPNLAMSPLGTDDGAGFGWQDITVFKIGAQWRSSPAWGFRAGYSFGDQPIPSEEMLFNILAPGVIEKHASVGVSRGLGKGKELTFALTRAFRKSVSGPNTLEAPEFQDIELTMDQWVFDMSFSFGF